MCEGGWQGGLHVWVDTLQHLYWHSSLPAGTCLCTSQRCSLVRWAVAHSPSHTALACRSAVMLSFGAFPAEVPARVRFLHPLHNFTIVSYDPRQLSEEVRSFELQCYMLIWFWFGSRAENTPNTCLQGNASELPSFTPSLPCLAGTPPHPPVAPGAPAAAAAR